MPSEIDKPTSDASWITAAANETPLAQPDRIHRALRRLTIAVTFLALAVFLLSAAVYGSLVNYFSGDALLFGGTSVGAAVLGFLFGLFAGRRR